MLNIALYLKLIRLFGLIDLRFFFFLDFGRLRKREPSNQNVCVLFIYLFCLLFLVTKRRVGFHLCALSVGYASAVSYQFSVSFLTAVELLPITAQIENFLRLTVFSIWECSLV